RAHSPWVGPASRAGPTQAANQGRRPTMFTDDSSPRPALSPRPAEARGPMFRLAALVLTVAALTATGFLLLRRPPAPPAPSPEPADTAPTYFQDWPRPDVALVLSGQQYGYLQPCGCTRPQYGGLARRFNFLQTLRDRGWPVVAADLGDVAQKAGPQTM